MAVVAFLIGVVVAVLLVAWLVDRRDRAAGSRTRPPGAIAVDAAALRRRHRWRRAVRHRWMSPVDDDRG